MVRSIIGRVATQTRQPGSRERSFLNREIGRRRAGDLHLALYAVEGGRRDLDIDLFAALAGLEDHRSRRVHAGRGRIIRGDLDGFAVFEIRRRRGRQLLGRGPIDQDVVAAIRLQGVGELVGPIFARHFRADNGLPQDARLVLRLYQPDERVDHGFVLLVSHVPANCRTGGNHEVEGHVLAGIEPDLPGSDGDPLPLGANPIGPLARDPDSICARIEPGERVASVFAGVGRHWPDADVDPHAIGSGREPKSGAGRRGPDR